MIGTLILAAATHAASAQEAPYLDDRSSAGSLVRSLYNAINRKEYARAWSYFGEEKPAKGLQAYSDGFKSTTRVNVKIGEATTEGVNYGSP